MRFRGLGLVEISVLASTFQLLSATASSYSQDAFGQPSFICNHLNFSIDEVIPEMDSDFKSYILKLEHYKHIIELLCQEIDRAPSAGEVPLLSNVGADLVDQLTEIASKNRVYFFISYELVVLKACQAIVEDIKDQIKNTGEKIEICHGGKENDEILGFKNKMVKSYGDYLLIFENIIEDRYKD